MPTSDPGSSRLAAAIRLGLEFRAGGRTDTEKFLAEHGDLRDLLEPIVEAEAARAAVPERSVETRALRLEPGARVAGYWLEHELGSGGMGTVFAAWQRSLDRRVALKVLTTPALRVSERVRARFVREGRVLAALTHPGIVKVIDVGCDGPVHYLVMELVDGTSLARVLAALRRAGAPPVTGAMLRAAVLGAARGTSVPAPWSLPDDPVAAALAIVAEVAEALQCAHDAGVVHRDVKPGNILVRRCGRASLADFGIARSDDEAPITLTGDVVGTPSYMSPEQARGERVGPASDVFSLGIVLYEALTLRSPFAASDAPTTVARLLHEEPADVRRFAPDCSADVSAVVERALEKSPSRRYPSARAFAEDARAAAAGRPVTARSRGALARGWRWAQREPWRAAALVLVVAGLAVIAGQDLVAAASLRAETTRSAAALAEVRQLDVGVRLDRVLEQAAELASPRLADVPVHEEWLRHHGEPLAAELPSLEASLTALQAAAMPYDDVTAAADRAGHPRASELAAIESEIEWQVQREREGVAGAVERRALLAAARESMLPAVVARRTWRFDDDQRQFVHDQLSQLVVRLREFAAPGTGELHRIRDGVRRARDCHRRCVASESAAAAWRAIVADVAGDVRFGGLRLVPHEDLLPLGKGPEGFWEFVHLRSGAEGKEVPRRDANGRLVPGDDDGIVFVLLPGGAFAMGAQKDDPSAANHDPGAQPAEDPVHVVQLAPFFCGKYELTQGQWLRLAGDNPSWASAQRGEPAATHRHPVDSIAPERTRRVLAGFRLRLPTEAQWEYACRAGTSTPWHFGTRERAPDHANFADRAAQDLMVGRRSDADLDDGWASRAPVGNKLPNAMGLHDLHGNVAELVDDYFAPAGRPRRAGRGVGVPIYPQREVAVRGGHAQTPLSQLRSSERGWRMPPDGVSQFAGGRAVREVDVAP